MAESMSRMTLLVLRNVSRYLEECDAHVRMSIQQYNVNLNTNILCVAIFLQVNFAIVCLYTRSHFLRFTSTVHQHATCVVIPRLPLV